MESPAFSLSSFTFIKRLFSSSSLSSIKVTSSAYWGYWYFSQKCFQIVLHPAHHFSWCTLHRSYISRVTIYSLDICLSQFGTSPCSMSSSDCCFLTCIQISQEEGKVVWYPYLLKNFPQFVLIHRVKDFCIVSKAEVDVFLELSCFLNDPTDVDNFISGSSDFSKSSLNTWKFSVHVLLKPGLENFENDFAGVWDECNCAVVWRVFGIALLGLEWKLTFSSPVATAEFSKFAGILCAALSQHHLLVFGIA